jgi:hypothetical protein
VGIDLRVPLGSLFSVVGVLLTAYGIATLGQPGTMPTGVSINVVWGVVLLAFGVGMLLLARRARARGAALPPR